MLFAGANSKFNDLNKRETLVFFYFLQSVYSSALSLLFATYYLLNFMGSM
jgi:hypothetical protein